MSVNSFSARETLTAGAREFEIYNPLRVPGAERLPYCLKILLENLLRHEDGETVGADDIRGLVARADGAPARELAYRPARVLMQDFTGVPAVVDLAAMREAMGRAGQDPARINPTQPVDLVVDHSVQVDGFGDVGAFDLNARLEYQRNRERYVFLKWAQNAFSNFRVVPPGAGIVHQVNLEFLARVVFDDARDGAPRAYPDTLVGTDSHTTMVNGIGVLGWGVGGIEAEASMLGQPIAMLAPPVVGMRLDGKLRAGVTATDLVLTVVERLREHGVVGKFVEFYGAGLGELTPGDRATIANMAPEYGATCGIFPIDAQTLRYLELTDRGAERVALVEAYARATGLWANSGEAAYDETLALELGEVVPSLAGPRRPQDRVPLDRAAASFRDELAAAKKAAPRAAADGEPGDGAVVIAAITSCTNTSNPSVMLAAGLLARAAAARGLKVKPWVKTSLAPGSQVVTRYLEKASLIEPLQQLGFHVVGYGCTTCIGNSGPLPEAVSRAIGEHELVAVSVLSGNRNFEGRVHPEVRMNYLASPPLVVAYALAGDMGVDLYQDPLGEDADGQPVFLKDLWPSREEIETLEREALSGDQFHEVYAGAQAGDARWRELQAGDALQFGWGDSTYIARPPYFDAAPDAVPNGRVRGARVLAYLGDSVTTDHISPAGSIAADSPAGRYLRERGVEPADFNSYGSRRGNHEVMVRGTFANIRLRNKLTPEIEGGYTTHLPSGEQMTIYEAAMRYRDEGAPVVVIAGCEYGTGSSRDWAAKGPRLMGVRAVIAESFERIHRSNLVGMGILPLEMLDAERVRAALTGRETFDFELPADSIPESLPIVARDGDRETRFDARVRIDTPREADYYRHGGILRYVLSRFAN